MDAQKKIIERQNTPKLQLKKVNICKSLRQCLLTSMSLIKVDKSSKGKLKRENNSINGKDTMGLSI